MKKHSIKFQVINDCLDHHDEIGLLHKGKYYNTYNPSRTSVTEQSNAFVSLFVSL